MKSKRKKLSRDLCCSGEWLYCLVDRCGEPIQGFTIKAHNLDEAEFIYNNDIRCRDGVSDKLHMIYGVSDNEPLNVPIMRIMKTQVYMEV